MMRYRRGDMRRQRAVEVTLKRGHGGGDVCELRLSGKGHTGANFRNSRAISVKFVAHYFVEIAKNRLKPHHENPSMYTFLALGKARAFNLRAVFGQHAPTGSQATSSFEGHR